VTGLITGNDLLNALKGREADRILISCSMLREGTDCFLDDLTVQDVEQKTGISVRVVQNHGEDFLRALHGV
jgi:NifB/MoaA-like Fe-S oxidoreductase